MDIETVLDDCKFRLGRKLSGLLLTSRFGSSNPVLKQSGGLAECS